MTKSREIPAGEFKAKCLKLMDEVNRTGAELIITKHGKPVARLCPVTAERPSLVGCMKGTITILGDIVGPVADPDWEDQILRNWDRLQADIRKEKEGGGKP